MPGRKEMIVFWALLIWAIYAMVSGAIRRPGPADQNGPRQPGDAHLILDERARPMTASTPQYASNG